MNKINKMSLLMGFMAIVLSGVFGFWAVSCAPFQDSPFSDQLLSHSVDLNNNAIGRIKNVEADGVIRIAVLADAHQNYGDLDNVIYQINQTANVDFVVNLGDFSNSGYNLEYDQYIDSYIELKRPALTVIGNHDAIGAGPHLFKKAFSKPNYYFESDTKRYIFFNTANLEDPEDFDPSWLQNAVSTSSKAVIIFTHCSLKDPERFAGTPTGTIFENIIQNPMVDMVVNGHDHVYNLDSDSGTVLLQDARVQDTNWLLLEITGTQLKINNMHDGTSTEVTLKN